jgi:3-oxoacyl-[acyl-carrier protein] reductase
MAETPRTRELDLLGKVAIITGASRGIGRAIALNLASRGCSILGTCTSEAGIAKISGSLHDEVCAIFSSTNRPRPESLAIHGKVADIFDPTCHLTLADAIVALGRVDIFVNNACDPMPGTIGAMSVDEIQHSMIGNIQTPVLIVDELVKRKLFQKDSRIIYISSIRQRQPWSKQLMYSATKAAGESMCRTWAQAFGGKEPEVSVFLTLSLGKNIDESSTNSWPAQQQTP